MTLLQEQALKLLGNTTEKFNGCRMWKGAVDDNGFAYAKISGKKVLAHRFVKLYHIEYDDVQLARLGGLRLNNTCGHSNCLEPLHWQFSTSKPEKIWESDEALRSQYATLLG